MRVNKIATKNLSILLTGVTVKLRVLFDSWIKLTHNMSVFEKLDRTPRETFGNHWESTIDFHISY